MKYLIYVIFVFSLVGCNEIPQGAIIDQSEALLDGLTDPVIDEQITRPSDQIFINSDYCVCKKGQPVNVSAACENTCSNQATNDNTALMYINVNVGAELQNSQFQNLKGWCTQNLLDPDTGDLVESGNPDCQLIFTDKLTNTELGAISIPATSISDNSVYSINVDQVALNRQFSFKIREVLSGIESDVKDITIYTELVDTLLDIPLTIEGISQYACIQSDATTDPNNPNIIFTSNAQKIHFYYDHENKPDPSISTTSSNLNCHVRSSASSQTPPTNDTALIDNTPGQIRVWSKGDIRFGDYVDPDTNTAVSGVKYIDKILQQLYEEISGQSISLIQLFTPFEYFTDPISASDSGGSTELMGYMMRPFRNPSTQKWYCPTSADYYATNADPLMKALREVVVNDTQAIYFAKQQNKDNDFIFILEEDIKDAWFYLNESNQEVSPTDATIRGKKLQFYWPISEDTPLVKKPHQVIYNIQSPSGETNPANLPDDKRIGCAPKI